MKKLLAAASVAILALVSLAYAAKLPAVGSTLGAGLCVSSGQMTICAGGITNAMLAGAIDLATKVTGTLAFGHGGTGQTTYTDGQLLIGKTSTGGLAKASLTAGANVTITPGDGSITIASTGGGGSGCNTSGSVGQILLDDGSGGCTSTAAGTGVVTALGTNAGSAGGIGTIGTSGATVGLLNANKTDSGNNTHSGVETFTTVVGGGRIVTGTTDGPTAADCGKTIHFTSGSAITVTMPNSITTLQCTITFIQEGAGQISFAAGAGATIHSRQSFTKTAGQWGVVDMILNTNAGGTSAVYTLAGDGAA